MQNRKGSSRRFRRFLGISLGLMPLGLFISFATSPDFDLHFKREVPSRLSGARLDRNIASLGRWRQWFYHLDQVENINPRLGMNADEFEKNSLLRLKIDPKKGERKKFELIMKVADYEPGKNLRLELVEDSSGRLTRIFQQVRWAIHFEPSKEGTLIQAESQARTQHWKGRLFGKLSERIVMNQTFYPNLLKLSDLRQPYSFVAPPGQSGMFGP